jgi:flagellar biosynthesis protein FlhF
MNTGERSKNNATRELLFAPQVYEVEPGAEPEANTVEALRIELRNEVRALRQMFSRSSAGPDLSGELAAIRAALDAMTPPPTKRDKVGAWLRARGIEGPAATRIAASARDRDGDADTRLRSAIAELVEIDAWNDDQEGRRIAAFVGPSGVGKTTTAAKLAARARMRGRSVALVACDGFRVGATFQLERYAELLGATFHVADNGIELTAVLEDAKEDLVIVDTSGRPPGPSSPEATLMSRRRAERIDVILCVTAATRAADASKIASTFAPARPTAVAVTKLDETYAPSGLVHAPFAAKRPLAVLSAGPRVPEDVEPASIESVLHHLHAGEKEPST